MVRRVVSLSWVFLLRLIAGFMNVTTILIFTQMVGGHTGSFSHIAIELAERDWNALLPLIIVSFSFLIGTIISGVLYPKQGRLPNQYGLFFLLMGISYYFFAYYEVHTNIILAFMSAGLGFQNGMQVTYHGKGVRTTILTGVLTDVGVLIGRGINEGRSAMHGISFHLMNLASFMAGSILAATCHIYSPINILYIAGSINLCITLFFFGLRTYLIEENA